MAMAHKHIGKGIAIAIDPWSCDASKLGQVNPADAEWWSDQSKHDIVFKQFNDKIIELGLQNVVKIIRKSSNDVIPPERIGIWHCDGNHSMQALTDVKRFAPNIVVGGLAILDDINWSGGGVSMAAAELLKMGFIELYSVDDHETQNKWSAFQRIK